MRKLNQNKTKLIPNIDILYSCFSRKNKKMTESLVFQCLWNKDEISPTPSFSCFFLEYQEYKMSISEFVFILYFLKLSACPRFKLNQGPAEKNEHSMIFPEFIVLMVIFIVTKAISINIDMIT